MSVGKIDSSTTTGATDAVDALRSALQNVSKTPAPSSSAGSTVTTSSAAQEALETPAQTKAEAAKGDSQAKLKLTHDAAAQAARNPASTAGGKHPLNLNKVA